MGQSVESPSLDATGSPRPSTAHSPYTLPEEASTNEAQGRDAARSRSTAVAATLAATAPSGSSTEPLTPERAAGMDLPGVVDGSSGLGAVPFVNRNRATTLCVASGAHGLFCNTPHDCFLFILNVNCCDAPRAGARLRCVSFSRWLGG